MSQFLAPIWHWAERRSWISSSVALRTEGSFVDAIFKNVKEWEIREEGVTHLDFAEIERLAAVAAKLPHTRESSKLYSTLSKYGS